MKKIKIKTNKNAILLPETLKIVIAVLCILLLIYLATKVLGVVFTRNAELEKARETLDAIAGKAEVLEPGESLEYLVTGPKGWKLISYPPKLCVCPEDKLVDQEATCKQQGACKSLSMPLEISQSSFEINSEVNSLYLTPLPLVLRINYNSNKETLEIFKIFSELGTEELILFENFLNSKSNFTNLGEITIQAQILNYVNSGNWGRSGLKMVWQVEDAIKEDLYNNIKTYFKDYDYPIWIIIDEAGKETDTLDYLAIDSGNEREINNGEILPSWPKLIIANQDKSDIIVKFRLRE